MNSLFPRSTEVTYLDTAAEGLPAPGLAEALLAYQHDKATGTPGRKRFYQVATEATEMAAQFLGTATENVALLSSSSEGISALAGSLVLEPGDEIIINDLEFPSNVLPWLRLKERGVQVNVLRSQHGALTLDDILEQLTPQTKIISLSAVSYKSGARVDFLPSLAKLTKERGIILAFDVTQALARVPVSLEGVDFLICSGYKWLLAPHGLAIVYVAPSLREKLSPLGVGWYSVTDCFTPDRFERYELKAGAACFTIGMPNFPSIYGFRQSMEFLQTVDVAELQNTLAPVVERVRSGLAAMGLRMLTPPEASKASGIVSFEHPNAEALGAGLENERIIVWAGDGRVRSSVHLYNDMQDAERYLQVLQSLLQKPEFADGR